MGGNVPSKCCRSNDSLDRDNLNKNLSGHTHRANRTTLYHSDSSGSGDDGERSYSDEGSDGPYIDPSELALQVTIIESFKAALQNGNTSLVEYYFNEHPSLMLGTTKWRNGSHHFSPALQMLQSATHFTLRMIR